ncbi:hypothetical protein LWI29_032530 [Acer saccharum]|uniref:Peptidase S54 rhomboid domain-containing protein n=1 Tax=Acer saccharum TaxID=4024 RepID=A0AA39VSE5_ACESA|nr:hypothetical protein LWI29_032530 [Acer saccharum]
MGSAPHQPFEWVHIPLNATTTTASLRLGHHLRLGLLLRSSFQKNLSRLCPVRRLKDLWCQRAMDHIILAANILIYIAQIATQGKLMLWGAKINSLIDKGQFWRLATSSLLHAILHTLWSGLNLMAQNIFFVFRFTSAQRLQKLGSTMSYQFCKAPAVGASGAIFGLVGSLAVFIMRHRGMVEGGREELQHIAQVIFYNMAIGFMFKGIDNWGHLGGLLGGVAMSWFLGPAWKYESMSNDGSRIFTDKAPIFYFINRKRRPGKLN